MVVCHVAVEDDFAVADEVEVLLGVEFLVLLGDDCVEKLLRMIWWDERVLLAVDQEHGTSHRFHVLEIIVVRSHEERQKCPSNVCGGLLHCREWTHQNEATRLVHSG